MFIAPIRTLLAALAPLNAGGPPRGHRRRTRRWRARGGWLCWAVGLCPAVALAQAPHGVGNTQLASFRAAKSVLAVLYAEHPCTLYSDCRFGLDHRVDYAHCAYVPRQQNARAARIEWEHIVPAEAFGRHFAAWREGDPRCVDAHGPYKGRRCAAKASPMYRRMESDLYNLVPEIGEVNRLRSNKPMGEVLAGEGEPLTGIGGFVAAKAFVPRDQVKGDVARTYLYMHAAYPNVRLLAQQKERLFLAWSLQDPVDAWECRRAFRIEGLQGNENHLVKSLCVQAKLWPQPATYGPEPAAAW